MLKYLPHHPLTKICATFLLAQLPRLAAQDGGSFSDPIPLGSLGGLVQRTGAVAVAAPEDWYSLEIKDSVRAVSFGVSSGLDANVDLAVLRDANDDGVPEVLGSERIFNNGGTIGLWLDPGRYYVRLKYVSGATSYRLGVSSEAKPDSAGEQNNLLTKAADIGSPTTLLTVNDFIGIPDSQDWYRLQINGTVRKVNIGIGARLSANLDLAVLRDLNNDGVPEILGNTRIFNNGGSLSLWLDPGSYFIRILEVNGNTEYQLGVSSEEKAQSAGETNNELATATDIGFPTTLRTITDFAGAPDLRDYYRFQVKDTVREVNLGIASGLSENLDVAILRDLNNDGVPEVLENSRIFNNGGSMSLWLDPGTYFARVQEVNGNTEYQLGISSEAKPESPGETNNQLSKSTDIGSPTTLRTIPEFVGLSDLQDWYRFLVRGTTRNVSVGIASGLKANLDLSILRDLNNDGIPEIVEKTRVFNNGDSIQTSLPPGTYFLLVAEVNGNTPYSLGISQSLPTNTAPFILTQPAGLTVVEGRPARIVVEADGSGTLSYQWFRNGVQLDGRTSTELVISSSSLTDAGNYTVKITSPAGQVTSLPAQLVVNPAGFEVQIADAIVLSWPVSAGDNVIVEGTNDASASGSWTSVPVTVITVGNRHEACVRRVDQMKFYRLRKP